MPDSAALAAGTPGVRSRRITLLDVLRLLSEVLAFASIAAWGFLAWAFPWNVVAGIGAPVLAILAWALFVSPKAVLPVHPFLRALVELAVFLTATIALWGLDLPWLGVGVGAFAVVIGVLHNLRAVG
ncbi:YrdB family protein [Microbacterium betulae]|uniref:YrdB family protein n=1 Tax=Microbacterium betulae TaxID=2981139 RepID=A0AA97FJ56_9MICO|nr:YrdB family protein [Microbacterium sp. AB]WOF24010.1 YrdB family protein [Microbacterium sp. AB]